MDIHDPDKQLCQHCDKILPRRTVYRHMKDASNSHSLKRKRDENDLVDIRRWMRCRDSSDDEEEEEECRKANNTSITSTQSNHVSEEFSLSQENQDETIIEDSGDDLDTDTEFWENEDEDDVDKDIEDNHSGTRDYIEKDASSQVVKWILCSLLYLQTVYKLSNNCVEHFLMLLNQIFIVLGKFSSVCVSISKIIPTSIYLLRKWISFDRDNFEKFLVCPNCMALYKYQDIVYEVDGRQFVKKCTNKVFGSRVDASSVNCGRRGKFKCDANLVKEVHLSSGTKYYPLKTFCYKHVINSLEELLKRTDFRRNCNQWRLRKPATDSFCDIFDGNVWKKFQVYKGMPFLSEPNNFAVMINVDWFQPYKRRKDVSIGVLYMVFMNLPRHLRFKPENILLLGIIPALSKEPETLNSFLKPLVDELKVLEKGINLFPDGNDEPLKCKMLVLCASSDIPAARKLCGFMGHAALRGCSFCTITFADENGERYCGGFEKGQWTIRTRDHHVKYGQQAKNAKNLTQKKEIERSFGYKYTRLLDLEYFEPSVFCVVEPMHNLFLGTAKRLFGHWVDTEMLSKSDLEKIGTNISKINVPADIGRIPSNIGTNFGQFTADEWKNWVLVYSLFALHNVLPLNHLKVWQTFVLACFHICRPMVMRNNIRVAHRLFLKFTKEAESLYGSKFITPNMHLHAHLQECIENFGSIYGFWAFSFERYNGLLADFPNNKRSVEMQIMRKFQQVGFATSLAAKELGDHFEHFEKLTGQDKSKNQVTSLELQLAPEADLDEVNTDIWCDLSALNMKTDNYKLLNLCDTDKEHLLNMYKVLYETPITIHDVASVAKKFVNLHWDNQYFGSKSSYKGNANKMVLGKWATDQTTIASNGEMRPGVIRYFVRHVVEVDGIFMEHTLALVDWYKRLHEDRPMEILPPATLWSTRVQNDGPASYIPIQRLSNRCAWATVDQGARKYLVVCPLPRHVFT